MNISPRFRMCAGTSIVLAMIAFPVSAQVTTGTVAEPSRTRKGQSSPARRSPSPARRAARVRRPSPSRGRLRLPERLRDTYTIEVAMASFKTLKRRGIRSAPATASAVGTLTLEVGGADRGRHRQGRGAAGADESGERSFTVTTEGGREPADREPQLPALATLAPGVDRHDPAHRRRRRQQQQHHDGRRLDDGHRQQLGRCCR